MPTLHLSRTQHRLILSPICPKKITTSVATLCPIARGALKCALTLQRFMADQVDGMSSLNQLSEMEDLHITYCVCKKVLQSSLQLRPTFKNRFYVEPTFSSRKTQFCITDFFVMCIIFCPFIRNFF